MTNLSYQFVPGFFIHDLVAEQPLPLPAVPPRFGLIDTSNDRWAKFEAQIRRLNQDSPAGTTYRFFLLARHGQGYHNVALSKYGRDAWNEHWSKLDGDGELVWGRMFLYFFRFLLHPHTRYSADPQLTSLGIEQARVIQDMWKTETSCGLSPPHKIYCSPLTRALHTCEIMLDGVFQHDDTPVIIRENCREEYGVHTCNKRGTKTCIATSYPHFVIEEGFTEVDELWQPNIRESKAQAAERARKVLDVIFEKDTNALFVTIIAHRGFITGFLTAIGRKNFVVPTGGEA